MARRLFEPRIPRRELNALRVVSLVDLALLVAVLYAVVTEHENGIEYLASAYGALFVVMLASLALAMRRGWWSWRFVAAVAIFGPLASVPGLEHYGRATRRASRPGSARRRSGALL